MGIALSLVPSTQLVCTHLIYSQPSKERGPNSQQLKCQNSTREPTKSSQIWKTTPLQSLLSFKLKKPNSLNLSL